MPVHDWTRADPGLFHHFHLSWICALSDRFNGGDLPHGYFALIEQATDGPLPADADPYLSKVNRITIRDPEGIVVSVIEIVSPGNKSGRAALDTFVEKAVDFLKQGINLLIIDLFPPTARDPQGIHKAIWDKIQDTPFELPPDKRLTLVSYSAGFEKIAYVEPITVGDVLPDMPLFLEPDRYVPAHLEATYLATWDVCPTPLKEAVIGQDRADQR